MGFQDFLHLLRGKIYFNLWRVITDTQMRSVVSLCLLIGSVLELGSAQTTDPLVTLPINTDPMTTGTWINNQLSFNGELEWTVWIPWSQCTRTCGGGQRVRVRFCEGNVTVCEKYFAQVRGITISYDIQHGDCNAGACPMNGMWMEWQDWENCTDTCQDFHYRRRMCDGPYNGGNECPGKNFEVEPCVQEEAVCDALDKARKEELSDEGPPFKAADSRPSAIGTGVVAVVFVIVELIILCIFDTFTCARHTRYCMRSIRYRRGVGRHARVTPSPQSTPLPNPESVDSYEDELKMEAEQYDDHFRN